MELSASGAGRDCRKVERVNRHPAVLALEVVRRAPFLEESAALHKSGRFFEEPQQVLLGVVELAIPDTAPWRGRRRQSCRGC